jgi:hypothetical protein
VTEAETRRPQAWARAINTLGHAGAETRQTPVALVLGEIGAVEGNNQPVEARGRHLFDVAGEKPAIGDHGTADAAAGDCRDKTDDFGVHQRLAALQRHISDPAAVEDRHRPRKHIGIDVAPRADWHLVARELAKIAGRIADVGDGKIADRWELQIERACSAGVGAVRCGASERRRFAQATSRDDHSVRALLTDASGALLEGEDSSMRHRPSSAKFAGASAHGFAFSPFPHAGDASFPS